MHSIVGVGLSAGIVLSSLRPLFRQGETQIRFGNDNQKGKDGGAWLAGNPP